MVYVMVKAPIGGAVKTRLATTVGTAEALRFYRGETASLLRRLGADPRWRTVLAVTPDRHVSSRFWSACVPRVAQGRGDLGVRMQRLLDASRGPCVVIGSDIPGIRRAHVAEAFRLLSHRGIVFGPSHDGGFWLVGARRSPNMPRPFRDVRWSTNHALADCLSNLPGRANFAAILDDVDTGSDWLRWRRGELGSLLHGGGS